MCMYRAVIVPNSPDDCFINAQQQRGGYYSMANHTLRRDRAGTKEAVVDCLLIYHQLISCYSVCETDTKQVYAGCNIVRNTN